jgi:pimeloyl-ACP methyl ester carboxylesterase
MNVYLIPGLGGDKRMYAGQLSRFPNTKVLEFIRPLRNERIASYAVRLAESIDKSVPFILIGVSFGGILAQEIALIYPPAKSIIISSVKSRDELPKWMKASRYFPVQRFIPGKTYLWTFMILISIRTVFQRSNNVIGNLKNMAKDADPVFVQWAVNQVINWHNPIEDFKAYHIHGDQDTLFPLKNIKKIGVVIKNGTHTMILTHVKEINLALEQELP